MIKKLDNSNTAGRSLNIGQDDVFYMTLVRVKILTELRRLFTSSSHA